MRPLLAGDDDDDDNDDAGEAEPDAKFLPSNVNITSTSRSSRSDSFDETTKARAVGNLSIRLFCSLPSPSTITPFLLAMGCAVHRRCSLQIISVVSGLQDSDRLQFEIKYHAPGQRRYKDSEAAGAGMERIHGLVGKWTFDKRSGIG